jgi:signal transduction histidine kinase
MLPSWGGGVLGLPTKADAAVKLIVVTDIVTARGGRRRVAGSTLVIAATVTAVWALAGAGYFWPGWVGLGLATPLTIERGVRWALRAGNRRLQRVQGVLSVVAVAICTIAWLGTGRGYPWPLWPLLGLAALMSSVAVAFPASRLREQELTRRVGVLTKTRQTVVEIQEAELRRVERDLHDGAQARLVSLGMSLGLAEKLLEGDPVQARRLLGEARTSVGAALSDLRGLVRGIRPPVLADRGLEGAIRALVVSVPIPVEVTMDLPSRALADPVETAVYFAVAELIANVVKHSDASHAWVRADHDWERLSVVVGDDGRGGADPAGGTGLEGIERRLAAFDGTMTVVSPHGGPTVVRVEVQCEP